MIAAKGHDPREPARRQRSIEIDLDVRDFGKLGLELRRLKVGARDAEPELTVEPVLRATGEDADAARDLAVAVCAPDPDGHGSGRDADVLNPGATRDHRSRIGSAIREGAIESAAIDYRGCDLSPVDAHRSAIAPLKSGRARDCIDGVAGKVELGEGIEAEHAGAVNRIADSIVFFENEDGQAFSGEPGGSGETGRPGADHDHIPPAC